MQHQMVSVSLHTSAFSILHISTQTKLMFEQENNLMA